MKKTCVVIVTYNRKEYLSKVLDGLRNQTRKISGLIIVDNHSSDNTVNMLYEQGYLTTPKVREDTLIENMIDDIKIHYFYSSENTGGSGGFNKAFEIFKKISLENNYEYLWAMDDDVMPDEKCLELLIKNIDAETQLCIPNRSDERYKDFAVTKLNLSNPFLVYMQKKKKVYNLEKEYYYIEDMPFEGPLITKELVFKTDLPDKDYFIFYDDTDYCHRLLNNSKGKFVSSAILHKQIIPKENKNPKMSWRHYYSYRNAIYFDKKYGKNIFVRNLSPIFLIIELYIKNILLLRFYNLKIIHKSYVDAKKGIRGKSVEPGAF